LHSGIILGSIDFAKNIINKYNKNKTIENIKKECFLGRPGLKDIFLKTKSKSERGKLIFKSYKKYGYGIE